MTRYRAVVYGDRLDQRFSPAAAARPDGMGGASSRTGRSTLGSRSERRLSVAFGRFSPAGVCSSSVCCRRCPRRCRAVPGSADGRGRLGDGHGHARRVHGHRRDPRAGPAGAIDVRHRAVQRRRAADSEDGRRTARRSKTGDVVAEFDAVTLRRTIQEKQSELRSAKAELEQGDAQSKITVEETAGGGRERASSRS